MTSAPQPSFPRVAVLMATFNGAAHIASQIASVLWQLRVHVDIFIRDDGSTDHTIGTVFEAFPGTRIHLIRDRPGPACVHDRGAALNFYRLIASKSLLVSGYDWVAFSDQDDIWLPNKLCSAINDCLQSGSPACSSSVLAFWGTSCKAKYIPKQGKASEINYLFESPGPGCTIVLRSDVFEELQGFVRANFTPLLRIEFHDWLVYAFVVKNYGSWFISPQVSMLYCQHRFNVAGAGFSFLQLRKKLFLVSSGWYRQQVLFLSALFNMDRHPALVRFSRFNFWDRIVLPFVLWRHRRRIKDRMLLLLVLPFSSSSYLSNRVY